MASKANKFFFIIVLLVLTGITSWWYFPSFGQWGQELSSGYFSNKSQEFRFASLNQGYRELVHVKQLEENCGVQHTCPENSFPVFLSTGTSSDHLPKLCVSGKYVIKPFYKGEGRGLNAAVVEPEKFKVVSVRNFDTYLYDKTEAIEEWISGILDNEILIIFTSDEASVRLTKETKSLLNNFGSGKIQNLYYRSQWYMISQKKTKGFTIYEKITYSRKKSWGEAIEFRGCIPREIPKTGTVADEPLKENKKKVQFCEGKKDDKYEGFCKEARFEIFMPALLTNKTFVGNPVFSLPIFVFAGKDLEVLIATLDSLLHQPGIVMPLVTILYEDNEADILGLAKIYGMQCNKTVFSDTFEEKIYQARELTQKLYPRKKHLIVLDSDVIPAPDFLFFMAQTFPTLKKDSSVSYISGWSANCYNHSGGVHLAYRIKGIPKYAALAPIKAKKDFYGDMYGPDVSRVQGPEACHLPSLKPDNWIERPQDLSKDRYYQKMIILQQLSQVINVSEVLSICSPSVVKNEINAIYVEAKNTTMSQVLKCLGVLKDQYGEYDGVVRLFVNEKTVLVITSESPFYKSRPIVSF